MTPLDRPYNPAYLAMVTDLARAEGEGAVSRVLIGPFAMFNLIGALQLVCRHPDLADTLRAQFHDVVDQFGATLIKGFSDPDQAALMQACITDSWNPDMDQTPTSRRGAQQQPHLTEYTEDGVTKVEHPA